MATNEEEVVVDLRKLKMTELRKELHDRGLKTSGNKQELVDRLQLYMEEHEGAEVADDELLKEEGEADEHLNDDPKIEDVSLTSDKEQEKTAVVPPTAEKDGKNTEPENEITALQTPAAVTDEERLKLRAQKFGLTTADMNPDARKAARSARFGTGAGVAAPDADVLKKRVERFGNVAADAPKGSADDERRRKRLARFGGDAADSGDVSDKKKQRAERFGLVA